MNKNCLYVLTLALMISSCSVFNQKSKHDRAMELVKSVGLSGTKTPVQAKKIVELGKLLNDLPKDGPLQDNIQTLIKSPFLDKKSSEHDSSMVLLSYIAEDEMLKKQSVELLKNKIEADHPTDKKRDERINLEFYRMNIFIVQYDDVMSPYAKLVGEIFHDLGYDYSKLKDQVESTLKSPDLRLHLGPKAYIELEKGKTYLNELLVKKK